jgi:hypothetical protein
MNKSIASIKENNKDFLSCFVLQTFPTTIA